MTTWYWRISRLRIVSCLDEPGSTSPRVSELGRPRSFKRSICLSEARYPEIAAIIECSKAAGLSKDLDGAITGWNERAERLFGHTAQEAVGKPGAILIRWIDRRWRRARHKAHLRQGSGRHGPISESSLERKSTLRTSPTRPVRVAAASRP